MTLIRYALLATAGASDPAPAEDPRVGNAAQKYGQGLQLAQSPEQLGVSRHLRSMNALSGIPKSFWSSHGSTAPPAGTGNTR